MATRFDPFQEFDRLLASMASGTRSASGAMPIDLLRRGDEYVLAMDLPGVRPDSIDVSVEDYTLTIRAERASGEDEDVDWLVRERPTGTFARQLTLGRGLALDQIRACYSDGVLALTIPVSEQARPRKIEVEHSSDRSSITADGEG